MYNASVEVTRHFGDSVIEVAFPVEGGGETRALMEKSLLPRFLEVAKEVDAARRKEKAEKFRKRLLTRKNI